MVVVRNLEITQHVDGDVKATKVLAEDIDGNVKSTEMLVKDNAKGIERVAHKADNGTKHFLCIFIHILTLSPLCRIIVTYDLKRLSLPNALSLILIDDTQAQGTNFDHGYLHQIPPSITILHAKLNTAGQQRGLSKATHSRTGRGMGHYYGSVEIVCFSFPFYLSVYQLIPGFCSGCGKIHSVVRGFLPDCMIENSYFG